MRRRLSVIICLLIAIRDVSYAQPTQGANGVHNESRANGNEQAQKGGETNKETKSGSHREAILKNGVAEKHKIDQTNHGKVDVIHGEDVDPSDSSDKDEILEENYLLPEGKPWKEERYTSDWLYSETFPALTAEVHWFCPFYINADAKESDNKRERGNENECVTTAQLKYWYQHQDKAADILLDTFRITYIPTYVLQETNVLKYIKPNTIVENKIMVNVTFQYHSDITCKQFTYEIQENSKAVKIKEEKYGCKKDDSFTTSFFTTTEWGWETDDDDEEDDFNWEAKQEEKDQNNEEEAHKSRYHQYEKEDSGGVEITSDSEHSDHKPSHREVVLDDHEHAERHDGNKH